MTGGTVKNGSRIDNLTYITGTYSGQVDGFRDSSIADSLWGNGYIYNGTIGTLTLAGDSANNMGNWGRVENLKFDSNGSGILTISAFADNAEPGFTGIQAMSFNSSPGITFDSAIKATNSVDFTYGNILLDLSEFALGENWMDSFFNALGFVDRFNLTDLLVEIFGGVTVTGDIEELSLQVAFGDTASFWLINDGVLDSALSFADNGLVVWNTSGTNSSIGLK